MTKAEGIALSATLYHKDTTILLTGSLGSGKTTFVQGLAEGLHIREQVTSPTYTIENRFGDKLLHIDLYRIQINEAQRIVKESEEFPGFKVIEWFDKACPAYPSEAKHYRELDEELTRTWCNRLEEREEKKRVMSSDPSPLEDTRSDQEQKTNSKAASHLPSKGEGLYRDTTRYFPHQNTISIAFDETSPTERELTITFSDLSWPNFETIEGWRREVRLPAHIARHCDAVGAFAKKLARELLKRGVIVRREAVFHAGLLHDLLRFVDFHPGSKHLLQGNPTEIAQNQEHWKELGKKYPGHHEEACAFFLTERGYPELARIIGTHGLHSIDTPEVLRTIEQKLLFYADKRVLFDTVVTLDERFDDFAKRYGDGVESPHARGWRERTKNLERELFGNEVP